MSLLSFKNDHCAWIVRVLPYYRTSHSLNIPTFSSLLSFAKFNLMTTLTIIKLRYPALLIATSMVFALVVTCDCVIADLIDP
jgi:hypothetical protein